MTRSAERTPRAGGDDGAAIVEFAFISILLSLLVFGIINFGLILSFKQDMTRAAAEGARAGAVALPTGTQTPEDAAQAAAEAATEEAVQGFDRSCDDDGNGVFDPSGTDNDGLTCSVSVAVCNTTPSSPTCVTVALDYDYDTHPLLAELPLLSEALPDTLSDTSVARINP